MALPEVIVLRVSIWHVVIHESVVPHHCGGNNCSTTRYLYHNTVTHNRNDLEVVQVILHRQSMVERLVYVITLIRVT